MAIAGAKEATILQPPPPPLFHTGGWMGIGMGGQDARV